MRDMRDGEQSKGATGFGVRTLLALLEEWPDSGTGDGQDDAAMEAEDADDA